MAERPTCASCRFFRLGKWYDVDRCRRFPPQRAPFIFYGLSFIAFAAFPSVDGDEWCGEYRAERS